MPTVASKGMFVTLTDKNHDDSVRLVATVFLRITPDPEICRQVLFIHFHQAHTSEGSEHLPSDP